MYACARQRTIESGCKLAPIRRCRLLVIGTILDAADVLAVVLDVPMLAGYAGR